MKYIYYNYTFTSEPFHWTRNYLTNINESTKLLETISPVLMMSMPLNAHNSLHGTSDRLRNLSTPNDQQNQEL